MLDEITEKLKLASRKRHYFGRTSDNCTPEIDAECAECLNARTRRSIATAQERFDTCHQFHRIEGLGHVIVRANFQSKNLVDNLAAGGQHQDRNCDTCLSDIPAHIEAIFLWHHDVEKDEIEPALGRFLKTLFSINGKLDAVALALKAVLQSHANCFFVFDHKNCSGHTRHQITFRRGTSGQSHPFPLSDFPPASVP